MDKALTAIVSVQEDCDIIIRRILADDVGLDSELIETTTFSLTREIAPKKGSKNGARYVHFRALERGHIYVEMKVFDKRLPIMGRIDIPGAKGIFALIRKKGLTGKILLAGRFAGDFEKGFSGVTKSPAKKSDSRTSLPALSDELLNGLRSLQNSQGTIERDGIGRKLADVLSIDAREAGPLIQQARRRGVLESRGSNIYAFVDPTVEEIPSDTSGDDSEQTRNLDSEIPGPVEFFSNKRNVACALFVISQQDDPQVNSLCDVLNTQFGFGLMNTIPVLRSIIVGWQEKEGYLAFVGIKVMVAPVGRVLLGRYPDISLDDCTAVPKSVTSNSSLDKDKEVSPSVPNVEEEGENKEVSTQAAEETQGASEVVTSSGSTHKTEGSVDAVAFDPSHLDQVLRLVREYREAEGTLTTVQGELRTSHALLKECIADLRAHREKKRELKGILASNDHLRAVAFIEAAKKL